MSLRYALASDRGSVREGNEDSVRAVPDRSLFLVADGMGGHVGGEVASQVAADRFIEVVLEHPVPSRTRDEIAIMRAAMLAANDEVLKVAARQGLWGMGTTLTAALIRGRTATIAHAGDSRGYLAHRSLKQLTRDHTMVAMLVESGALTESESHLHPDRHVLIQAVGTQPDLEPDVFQVRIPRRAQLLLCTDGLHDVLPAPTLLACAQTPDLEAGVARLVEAANAHGGPDNITVVLVRP